MLRTTRYLYLCAALIAAWTLVGAPASGEDLPVARATGIAPPSGIAAPDKPLILTPSLEFPAGLDTTHPLYPVIVKTWRGDFGEQPEWRLSLLCQGLKHQPRKARCTAYSSNCSDGGGPTTRWGTRVRRGICAADARYWGPGSVIWMGAPIEAILIVEDTGSAVKGQHRFDISFGTDSAAASRFGVRTLEYIPLYVAPVKRAWSSKPRNWTPPAPPISQVLRPVAPAPKPVKAEQGPVEKCG